MCQIQITRSFWPTILSFLAVLHLVHSQDTVTVSTIDDRNPAIQYSAGQWLSTFGDQQYNNTVTLCGIEGGTATYNFHGTQVSVFGTQGPREDGNSTISTYSIDNSSPSQYTVPPDMQTVQYKVQFYTSPPLPEGEYTLRITNLNFRARYWLDFIQVTSPVGAIPPSTSEISSDPTSTLTPAATSTQPRKAGISKGVIAGIALGASALVVLLLLAALLWKRRHLKLIKGDFTADLPPRERPMIRGNAHLEPFQVEQFASLSNIPTTSNGMNGKRTYDDVAPIISTENNVNGSHSLVNGHASDSAISQSTSEGREHTSETPHTGPSTLRPMSLSKLRPPYRAAASSSSTGNTSSAPVSQKPPRMPTPPLPPLPPQIPPPNRRSTDGGVRLAGGPPQHRTSGEEEVGEINDTSTLPPAYGSY